MKLKNTYKNKPQRKTTPMYMKCSTLIIPTLRRKPLNTTEYPPFPMMLLKYIVLLISILHSTMVWPFYYQLPYIVSGASEISFDDVYTTVSPPIKNKMCRRTNIHCALSYASQPHVIKIHNRHCMICLYTASCTNLHGRMLKFSHTLVT